MRTTLLAVGGMLVGILTTSVHAQDAPSGVWRGAYACRGTPIGLKLTISEAGRDRFTARAAFSPPGSPIAGEYELIGTTDPATGILQLRYTRWIARVPGYVMAAIRVTPDKDGKHLRGNVVFSGCDEPFVLAYGGSAEPDPSTEPPIDPSYRQLTPGTYRDRSAPSRMPPTAASNSGADTADVSPMSGTWDGRLTCGRTTSDVVLLVRPSTSQVMEAVLETYSADALLRPVPHFSMISRQGDAANKFRLVPKNASDQLSFDATLSQSRNELSGVSPTCGAFTLHRHTSNETEQPPVNRGQGKAAYDPNGSLAKRCQALSRWAGKISSEYPNMDMRHTMFGLIYPKAVLLFNDDDFVPAFGFRYDAAVKLDLVRPGADDAPRQTLQDAYEDVMSKCAADPFIRSEGQWIWGHGIFQKSLYARPNPWWESSYYGGDFATAAIRHFVQAAREKRRVLRNRLKAVEITFPSFSAGAPKVREVLASLSQEESYAWPSELASARESLANILNRLAVAEGERVLHEVATSSDPLEALKLISASFDGDPSDILSSMVPASRGTFDGRVKDVRHQLAVTLARPFMDRVQSAEIDLSGAKKVSDISSQSAQIFAMFSDVDRREYAVAINKRLDLILARLVQSELAELKSFPGGSAGLQRSAAWERAYTQNYSDYAGSAPIKEGRTAFLRDRAARLANSVTEAEGLLAHMDFGNPAAKAQATDALKRFLCWSGDGSLPESLEYDLLAAKFAFDTPLN